jgi:hypothetical protein
MEDVERSIRNSVVDILCFISSGKATEAQMAEIEKRMSVASEVIREALIEEDARS